MADRRTKEQILAELVESQDALRVATEKNAELKRMVPDPPAAVPEAEALAGCIRALDRLQEREGRNGYGSKAGQAVSRTILALCEKYGVPRFEKVTEPCTRRHIEDMNAVDVLTAVRRDFEGYIP